MAQDDSKQKLAMIVNKSEEAIISAELNFFIKYLTKELLEKSNIESRIAVTNLDDKFYARCVSTKSLNIENDKIIGKAKNNYTINFNRNMLENGFASNQQRENVPSLIYLVHAIAHEVHHISQDESFNSTFPTIQSIENAREEICRNYEGFYEENYSLLCFENEADIKGWETAVDILYKYAPKLYEKYGCEIIKKIEEIRFRDKNAQITAKIDGKMETIDRGFAATIGASKLILKEPDKYLTMYPNLKYVYNSNGVKKNYNELLQDKNDLLLTANDKDKKIIEKLYDEIINLDRDLIAEKSEQNNKQISQQPSDEKEEYQNPIEKLDREMIVLEARKMEPISTPEQSRLGAIKSMRELMGDLVDYELESLFDKEGDLKNSSVQKVEKVEGFRGLM